MMNRMFVPVLAIAYALVVPPLHAQGVVKYREFELGSDVASIAKLTGVRAEAAKVVRQRPVLLQELEWRPRYFPLSSTSTDAVDRMLFSFYNDQLCSIVVEYDARRTEGLTQTDIVAAISATYGMPSLPKLKPSVSTEPQYGQPDILLATWGNTEYTLKLVQVAYLHGFKLTVSDTRLNNLAEAARIEAARLDVVEAPQREVTRQQKEVDDARATEQKARDTNLGAFRP